MLNIHQELDRLLRRTEAAEIHREEFRGSEAMRLAESDDSYPRVVGALPPPSSHVLDASRNPTKPGTFSPLRTDRPWRQVAGPAVDVRLAAIGAAVKQAHRANRWHWVEAKFSTLETRRSGGDGQPTANNPPARSGLAEEGSGSKTLEIVVSPTAMGGK